MDCEICYNFEFNADFDNDHHVPSDKSFKEGCKWIYGIYSPNGSCIYVGQTRDFRKRHRQHRTHSDSKFKGERGEFIMLPLVQVPTKQASSEEKRYQKLMESFGQAQLSNRRWRKKLLTIPSR